MDKKKKEKTEAEITKELEARKVERATQCFEKVKIIMAQDKCKFIVDNALQDGRIVSTLKMVAM